MKHKSLNQLLCAATINQQFCDMLLHNPEQALATGYLGQSFALTPEEQELITKIQARDLEDLAARVYCWMTATDTKSVRSIPASVTVELDAC